MAIRHTQRGKQATEGRDSKSLVDLSRIDALLDEVQREREGERPEGFTKDEYAESAGINKSTAEKRLKNLVDGGKMRIVKHTFDGHSRNFYQYIE